MSVLLTYRTNLLDFMSFRDKKSYTSGNKNFTTEELAAIRPEEIEQWLKHKLPQTDQAHTELKEFAESISFFQSDKSEWKEEEGGDPTCSSLVKEYIQTIANHDSGNSKCSAATLDPSPPASLHLLWQEYVTGNKGCKAAKSFTVAEKKANAPVYYRRKVFWDCVQQKMNATLGESTAEEAIEETYQEYGNDASVKDIIDNMLQERRQQKKRRAAAGPSASTKAATLGFRPRTLRILWEEYEHGINGNKPAKYFTADEIRKHNTTYYNRKLIWDKMLEIMGSSPPRTSGEAIHQMRQDYGIDTIVSDIIIILRQERKKRKVGDGSGDDDSPESHKKAWTDVPLVVVKPNTSATRPAKLSRQPKRLITLWEEYDVGLNGNKPAKLFTGKERKTVCATFRRRKVVWYKIQQIMLGGKSAEAAISQIYQKYGTDDGNETPLGVILKKLHQERKEQALSVTTTGMAAATAVEDTSKTANTKKTAADAKVWEERSKRNERSKRRSTTSKRASKQKSCDEDEDYSRLCV